ncbi:guanylate kinase [Mariprofundus micogutta]|uniref:Guanylate kinase n=1 Tax=Mariprofundus micogutta TaxID=1921010 RepID=A0A1L8CN33_9PROT|nr:guanylate kinase [Mariprofundus micogutta]GAV20326.1 guanylate kinase [Mariprofundus micogutta]
MSGRLFIVSGPSGAGKSSLCTALLEKCPDLKLSISCTTRGPRPGEVDGSEYHFLTSDVFESQRDQGDFLEWANVHGNMYGTRQSDIEAMLAEGSNVLLEIDWQGAAQVAEKIPSAVRVFILPPSLDELKKRLTSRAQDSAEVVAFRVAAAEAEIAHAGEAHFQVINDDFDEALARLLEIFR